MKQKGFVPLVVLFFFVAAIAGVFYLGLNTKKFGQAAPSSTSQTTTTPSPAVSPPPTSAADWKTYTSAKFGFSVNYPETWNVRDRTDWYSDTEGVLLYLVIHPQPEVPGDEKSLIQISVVYTLPTTAEEAQIKRLKEIFPSPKYELLKKDAVIDGSPATELLVQSTEGWVGKFYILGHGQNTVFLFGFNQAPHETTVLDIIKSFRLIN